MTPTKDFREICARVEQGLTTVREAKVLTELVERLTWERMPDPDQAVEVCRHCGRGKGGGHWLECPAAGIE